MLFNRGYFADVFVQIIYTFIRLHNCLLELFMTGTFNHVYEHSAIQFRIAHIFPYWIISSGSNTEREGERERSIFSRQHIAFCLSIQSMEMNTILMNSLLWFTYVRNTVRRSQYVNK